jgi:hypothetical protein
MLFANIVNHVELADTEYYLRFSKIIGLLFIDSLHCFDLTGGKKYLTRASTNINMSSCMYSRVVQIADNSHTRAVVSMYTWDINSIGTTVDR